MPYRAALSEHNSARPAAGAQYAPAGNESAQKRVLFVVNAAWFFLSHRLAIARAARAAGYEVHLLAAVAGESEEATLAREQIVVHRAAIVRGGLSPWADLRFLLRAIQVMRAVGPALVHNVTVKPVLYGTLAARLRGVPAIVNAISGLGYAFTDASRWFLASMLRVAYRHVLRAPTVHVIFQNDDDAREFASAGLVEPHKTVLIRGSGVDLSEFQPAPEELTPTPLVVLPARMLRDKGVVEFAAAARQLRRGGCAARFILAGPLDASNPAALTERELGELTADGSLEWLGPVSDMPGLYRRAHVVCLPSYREGLPKSLIEACAAGRAIVTTDVAGCRAVVAHEVNGLLVPARDVDALAQALQRLVVDPQLRARFAAAGRARAEREFGVALVIEQTLGLYARALSAH
ncbi:MAG TPA: glycosyltransferase family 4 protein [Steroidobacteraceae bacterium]|jgi:glycosyltransferase involved in cell wall biosynthesis